MKIESCHFHNANYYYVTNNIWKHARRTVTSPSNLIFVTEGTLYIEMQNTRFAINQGEFLFLPLGVESIGYRPSNIHTAFYYVTFKSDDTVDFPSSFTVPDADKIRTLYALLIKNARLTNYPRRAVDALMHCLFYEISYQLSHTETQNARTLAEAIKEYVLGTVFRNVTVHDVAMHFGFSDDYINRVFSQAERITLKAYINRLKVERIEEILISTNTSLKTVAEKLGFPNTAALSKFYKYHTGITISEYRARFID